MSRYSIDATHSLHLHIDLDIDRGLDPLTMGTVDGVPHSICVEVIPPRQDFRICVTSLRTIDPFIDVPEHHFSLAAGASVRLDQYWAADAPEPLEPGHIDSRVTLAAAFRRRTAILERYYPTVGSFNVPYWDVNPIQASSALFLPLGTGLYYGEAGFSSAVSTTVASRSIRFLVTGFYLASEADAVPVATGLDFYNILLPGGD
jgi:hypothetical protein